jgi:hypothetical protein
VADGAFHFDVGLYAPLTGGLIVRYQGRLGTDGDEPATVGEETEPCRVPRVENLRPPC